MTQWIWQRPEWPNFIWDETKTTPKLAEARLVQGRLLGLAQGFNQSIRDELSSQALTDEMITTSAIEGETLDRDSVRSSIAYRLGLKTAGIDAKPDRYVEGLLDIMLDATGNYQESLTLERLKGWQAALFPTGYSGIQKINVGELREEGEMQIISGRPGKTKVHFVAPPCEGLKKELDGFIKWFNKKINHKHSLDGIIRSAIAHLWFEILHPFDDGNGRIGRAIIDMALAQDEKCAVRFFSLSKQIMSERKGYYAILEKTTKGNLDITCWLVWFLDCYQNAIITSLNDIDNITEKSKFWQRHSQTNLNDRQRKVLNKLLDAGKKGFVGGMTTRKYVSICKVSRATAYRELIDLVEKDCLKPLSKKGRSAAYEIK